MQQQPRAFNTIEFLRMHSLAMFSTMWCAPLQIPSHCCPFPLTRSHRTLHNKMYYQTVSTLLCLFCIAHRDNSQLVDVEDQEYPPAKIAKSKHEQSILCFYGLQM